MSPELPLDPREVPVLYGDRVERLAPGFEVIGCSASCPTGAIRDLDRRLYGVQFHPESIMTPAGITLLKNFMRPDYLALLRAE